MSSKTFTSLHSIIEEEKLMSNEGKMVMAYNGWVMGLTADLAAPDGLVDLKRELNALDHCIKLRYGSGPKDVPDVRSHMKGYVEHQTKSCHGFQVDNCHSTPLQEAVSLST